MHTPCKPLSVRTIRHGVPSGLVNRVIEPMSGFKLLVKVLSIRVRRGIIRKIELSNSPVGRIRDKAAKSREHIS
jgi:hypothetical protein